LLNILSIAQVIGVGAHPGRDLFQFLPGRSAFAQVQQSWISFFPVLDDLARELVAPETPRPGRR